VVLPSQLKSVGEELKQQSEESMLASQALSSKAAAEALSEAQKEVAEYEKTVTDSRKSCSALHWNLNIGIAWNGSRSDAFTAHYYYFFFFCEMH